MTGLTVKCKGIDLISVQRNTNSQDAMEYHLDEMEWKEWWVYLPRQGEEYLGLGQGYC